jgi:arginyl-tRNA--protein-N-Asp/Glu arginylyltransferase
MEHSDPESSLSSFNHQEVSSQASSRFPPGLPILEAIENVHDCSYLAGLKANLPLRLPERILTLEEFDDVLSRGIRRSGVFLYHTDCDSCNACEPTRVDVTRFHLRGSFRRVLQRGDRELRMAVCTPFLNEDRVRLFNQHRTKRGLGESDQEYQPSDYENFLVDTCCPHTIELSFWLANELVGVSIIDCGRVAISAVYTFFDPQYSRLSIGTYSILKQIEFAQKTNRQFVYLGLYVQQNQHLNYKARFTPQERLIDGRWVAFEA